MPISFRYPRLLGTGAAAGGNLDTACGQYTPPGFGTTTTIHGKVYLPAGPFDPTPPPSASRGSCDPVSGTWDFNACWPSLGGGLLAVGTMYVLRVWQKDSNSSAHIIGDCPFTACQSGVGTCMPDCGLIPPPPPPPPTPPPPPPGGWVPAPVLAPSFGFGCESIVIRETAARSFRVTPSAAVVGILEMFYGPDFDPEQLAIVITYDAATSTHDRAIWTSQPQNGEQLRLEVQSGGCCHEAVMTRIRVLEYSIETLGRWGATCFDLAAGGELGGFTADCCLRDGGLEVRPVGEVVPAPPPPEPAPARAAPERRGRRGRA